MMLRLRSGQQAVPENNAVGIENHLHTFLQLFRICKAFSIIGPLGLSKQGEELSAPVLDMSRTQL